MKTWQDSRSLQVFSQQYVTDILQFERISALQKKTGISRFSYKIVWQVIILAAISLKYLLLPGDGNYPDLKQQQQTDR